MAWLTALPTAPAMASFSRAASAHRLSLRWRSRSASVGGGPAWASWWCIGSPSGKWWGGKGEGWSVPQLPQPAQGGEGGPDRLALLPVLLQEGDQPGGAGQRLA